MKKAKNILALLLSICLVFCMSGCAEGDAYDNFDPVGVRVVESIGGMQYESLIEDESIAKKMWKKFDNLIIDTEERGEMGTSYIYMCFYDEDQSTLGIFTMYENGSCCLGEDFSTFYTVDDGQNIYLELCDIHTEYAEEHESETESETQSK